MITIPLEGASAPQRATPRHKIVLYNPQAVFFTMPLGLLAVGSALDPAQYEVVIVDARLEADPLVALLQALDGALCLGIGVLTGAPIRDAVQASRAAKAQYPQLTVVWGGWHPSLFARECLEELSVDVTVQGQGEDTFAEIVARLARGQDLAGCEGCTFRCHSGTIVENPARTLRNINGFRQHNYELLPVERYFALKGKRQLDYISSQGCNFRCAFCADPFVYKRKWTGFEPQRVADEVATLWERYRFDDLSLQDETYFTRAERVAAIAEAFVERKLPISWAATMRADQGDRLPEEVFALCKRSGLRRVIIGVESGSQEMMDWIKKDIKLEQVFRSAEKCRRHGIAVIFPFIVGFPGESDESVAISLDVARQLRAMSPTFTTPIFFFKPYPGSPITDAAVADGYELPRTLDEWADFDFIGSAGPWVTPQRQRLVERYKFYQQVGYERPKPWGGPLAAAARLRVKHNFFALPVEKLVSEWLHPPQQLS
jgi:anaerobic magnesium-protoporphyrin IX monomethyl ester cyclase